MSFPIPQRIILCLLIFLGLFANSLRRLNINFAIVYMVDVNGTAINATVGNHSKLNWSAAQQELVKSAFFYGYFILQVPYGRLAELFGTKKVLGISMTGATVLGFLTPLVANISVWAVFVLRIMQGLCEATMFPALNPMISKWIPHNEKSNFVPLSMGGSLFGAVLTYPLCGFVITTLNWQAVFYITSGISLAWCLAWFLLVSDLPEDHPYITEKEMKTILDGRTYDPSSQNKESSVPFLPLLWDALTTPAMLAVMACETAGSCGLYILLTEGPQFFHDVLKFDISENGWLSGMPYLANFIGAQIFGFISRVIIKKSLLSNINLQKVNVFIECIIPAAGLIWMSFMTSSPYLCVAIMSVSFGFYGSVYNGHVLNSLTIAPNRSGIVVGLANTCGAMTGFIVPSIKSAIVGETTTGDMDELIKRWQIFFCFPSIVYAFATVVFTIWGSGEPQKFNWRTYSKIGDDAPVEVKPVK